MIPHSGQIEQPIAQLEGGPRGGLVVAFVAFVAYVDVQPLCGWGQVWGAWGWEWKLSRGCPLVDHLNRW